MSGTGTDDTTIQHRFVQIHQTRALELDQTEKLWTILARQNLSPIAVSNACDKIIKAIQDDKLRYQDTLQGLQNLVLTTDQSLKSSIFLHTITQLLLLHIQNKKFRSVQFCLSTSLPGVLHPFVLILRENPESYYDLLSEIDFCFENISDEEPELADSLFQVFTPFFDAVFFTNLGVDSTALLNKCTSLLMGSDEKGGLRYNTLNYLMSVSQRYPTQRSMHHHLALVDILICALTTHVELNKSIEEKTRVFFATNMSYQLLIRACDAAVYGRPTLPYIQRFAQLEEFSDMFTGNVLADPSPSIVWVSLSYLLMVSQTVSDQALIIKTMYAFVDLVGPILSTALIPLLQTLPEVVDSRENLKSSIMEIISKSNETDSEFKDNEDILKEIKSDISKHHITGVMANMLPHLINFFKDKPTMQVYPVDTITMSSSLSCIYTLLFSTPHIFNSDEGIRRAYLDRISAIVSSNYGASYKFPALLLLLHLLRHPVITTDTILYILQSVLPSFADPNDLTMTSKILQITLAIIYGQNTTLGGMQSSRETTMASVGIKTLEKIYERQPRVWQELKRVLSDWVIRRKSITGFSRKNASLATLQMELSVLTTMRDLCISKPRECAPTILPMVISLLQSCQDLSITTLTIIVQTICACIRAGMAEPRSVWNVAMRYIAKYAMENDIDKVQLLHEAICDFFSIVGDKDELSEPYIEFKNEVLNDFLAFLIQCSNEEVQTFALKALSHFTAVDIATLLPEKAKPYVSEIASSVHPSIGYANVLAKLMSHELDSMLRGLFKEENSKKITPEETLEGKRNIVLVGEKEYTIGSQFVTGWENARVIPGLRSGYAISVLYTIHNHVDRQGSSNTPENMTKTKWYRCMQTSIADIGLTDHIMIRISCLSAWMALFEKALVGTEADIEARGTVLLKDLTLRLERSTVPGTTCNILLAVTGLIVTAYRIIPSFATASASQIIDILTSKYIMKAGRSTSYSTLLMSEEVQFAARFSLGYISACVITNEKALTRLLDIFLQNVTEKTSTRSIDTSLDLVQFANGFAAGHFTGALATWPTKTPGINELVKTGIESLLNYCNMGTDEVSESKALGIMMGWASSIKQDDMREIYQFAKDTLRLYIDGVLVNKGVLLGSTWVCAYGSSQEDQIDEESANLLESAMTAASLDHTMNQHYFHFAANFAKVNRLRMILSDNDSEESEAYQNILLEQVQKVQKEDPSSHERLAALFSLSSLLGVDYLNAITDQELIYAEAQKYNSGTRSPVLDTLTVVAGLTDGGSPVGNLKSGRIAAALCGKVVHSALNMRDTLQLKQDNVSSGSLQSQIQHQAMMAIANSSEPKTYTRLNNNTSYLRAIFDALTDIVDNLDNSLDKDSVEPTSLVFLCSIKDTPGPLPPVNWFNILTKLTTVSKTTWNECIMLASTHLATSMSLTEYIISQLSQDLSHFPKEIQILLLGEAGLGMVLELGGLTGHESSRTGYKRRGMDAVTKKTSVSEIRCIELVDIHAKMFSKLPILAQSTFLDTIKNHLPLHLEVFDEKKTSLVENLRSVVMYNVTLPLLERSDIEKHDGLVNVLQASIACSILDINQLTQANALEDWLTVETAYGKTIGIMEICNLKRTNTAVKRITETCTRLLILGVSHAMTWDVLAETIRKNSQSDEERLTWVVRFLDILIVIGSLRLPNCCNSLMAGISYGLRAILEKMWKTECNLDINTRACDLPIILGDTGHLLTFVINDSNKHKQGQQQIIKRILKMIELVERMEEKEPLKGFFTRVLRGCTKEAIGQDSQMMRLISYQ